MPFPRLPHRPYVGIACIGLYAGYAAWEGVTSSSWLWLLEAAVLALACVGLAMNRSQARWPIYAFAALTAAQWLYLVGYYAMTRWPYPSVLASVAGLIPGIVLLMAFGGVCLALERHFKATGA